jgi:hypothetical protein
MSIMYSKHLDYVDMVSMTDKQKLAYQQLVNTLQSIFVKVNEGTWDDRDSFFMHSEMLNEKDCFGKEIDVLYVALGLDDEFINAGLVNAGRAYLNHETKMAEYYIDRRAIAVRIYDLLPLNVKNKLPSGLIKGEVYATIKSYFFDKMMNYEAGFGCSITILD